MAPSLSSTSGDVFSSELGWIGLLWTGQGIFWLSFGHPSAAAVAERLEEATSLAWRTACVPGDWRRQLQQFSAGELIDLRTVPVDLSAKTVFQRRVLQACRRIAYGRASTYAQLARQVGSPQAARAVGQVMARNPVPLIIPCHRVLGSGGKLGGFSAPSGLAMKRRLIAMEAGPTAAARAARTDPLRSISADP